MFGANSNKDLKRQKVWVVSEMFYPEEVSTAYIMTRIADAIAADADVHVICGPIGYDKIIADDAKNQTFSFTYHRIKTFNANKNNIIGRLLRLLTLSLGMFFKGLWNIQKEDTVFIVTNPAFIIPFYAFIKKLKKNRLIVLVHDVFPENLIPSKVISSEKNIAYQVIKPLFNWGYRKANKLIVLGIDMLEVMRSKTSRYQHIEIIENWAETETITPMDIEANTLITEYHLQNKIVFNFAGNLGRVQGLEFLFKVIAQVTNPNVHFLFIGSGAMLPQLQQYVIDNHITCVTFAGNQPRSQQQLFLNAAIFGLVTLAAELYGLGVPSKSYNIMAAGKPILFIGNKDTEISKMVRLEKCGYAFDGNDEVKLVDFFNNLNPAALCDIAIMGQTARMLAETKYQQNIILKKFKSAILS